MPLLFVILSLSHFFLVNGKDATTDLVKKREFISLDDLLSSSLELLLAIFLSKL